MTVTAPAFSQLVGGAEQILQVQVTGMHARWDTTPTGQRVIHTYVQCRVDDTIKGPPVREIELRFLGGSVGTDHMVVSGLPVLTLGDAYILFVAGNDRSFCPLVGLAHGSYRLLRDAAGEVRVFRHNGEALRCPADVRRALGAESGPLDPSGMTIAAFRAAIIAEQTRGGAHVQ